MKPPVKSTELKIGLERGGPHHDGFLVIVDGFLPSRAGSEHSCQHAVRIGVIRLCGESRLQFIDRFIELPTPLVNCGHRHTHNGLIGIEM